MKAAAGVVDLWFDSGPVLQEKRRFTPSDGLHQENGSKCV